MTSNAHELGASVGAWNAVIRRARIGRERKAAALVVSSYARADGTHIHCGVARLAVDLEVSYSTAKRNLAWLRKVGLIELVRVGNRRRQLSDEYRLILGPDVLEDVEVLDPAEHKRLTDGLREANRSGDHGSSQVTPDQPVDNSDHGSPKVTPDQTEPAEDHGSSRVTPKTAITGQMGVDHGSPKDEPPSRLCISPKDLSPRTPTDDGALGERVTLGTAEAVTTKPRSLYAMTRRPGDERYEPPPEDPAAVEARARRGRAAVDAAIEAARLGLPPPDDHIADVIPINSRRAS